jgi:hypothetical protein
VLVYLADELDKAIAKAVAASIEVLKAGLSGSVAQIFQFLANCRQVSAADFKHIVSIIQQDALMTVFVLGKPGNMVL